MQKMNDKAQQETQPTNDQSVGDSDKNLLVTNDPDRAQIIC